MWIDRTTSSGSHPICLQVAVGGLEMGKRALMVVTLAGMNSRYPLVG